jgi:hypothetical protein
MILARPNTRHEVAAPREVGPSGRTQLLAVPKQIVTAL